MGRTRLDRLLVELGHVESRQKAQALIMDGRVLVDDIPITKSGSQCSPTANIRIRGEDPPYVSRGGLKLEKALDEFPVAIENRVCADLGASTGGFTDCLLQRGAAKVFAIDVGYGQLAWKLRQDPRVVVMERTNARHLESLEEPPTLIVGDLSFISLAKILPAIQRIAAPGADCVVLVKPQFEVGPEHVGKGGKVRDPAARKAAIENIKASAIEAGMAFHGEVESPLPGAKSGNIEHLLWLSVPDPSRDIVRTREEKT